MYNCFEITNGKVFLDTRINVFGKLIKVMTKITLHMPMVDKEVFCYHKSRCKDGYLKLTRVLSGHVQGNKKCIKK